MSDTIVYGCAACSIALLGGYGGPAADACPACDNESFYQAGLLR